MAAVLGSTAAIAIGCSLLSAPAANAIGVGDLVGAATGSILTTVNQTTTPIVTTVDQTTATSTGAASTVGTILNGTTSSVADTTSTVVGALTGTSSAPIVDLTGSGSGVVNTGSTSGLVGISADANGLSVGLLDGTASTTIGGAAATAGTPTTPTTPTSPTTPTTDPAQSTTTVATTDPPATANTASTTNTASTASGTAPATTTATTAATATTGALSVTPTAGSALATLQLSRSASTVYPVKDGYRDSVRFDVRGLAADGRSVGVTGSAVLKKAGRTVQSWALGGSTTSATWNGRVGSAISTGTYSLFVTAWSADGTIRTASTTVQVLSQHLVSRTVTTTSKVSAPTSSAVLPKAARKAFALGTVTVKLRTVAKVHGTAALVITTSTVKRSLALRSGMRTTTSVAVPRSSTKVTVGHRFAKGGRLLSMKAIWSYKALVR